jgi:6-phospho-3-hexuloisomerase
VVERLDARSFEAFAHAIADDKTVALHGLSREGLQIKGLAIRLFHLGLDAHVVGEMTTPPIGAGDLLICSAGPGDFARIAALSNIAKDAGAKTAIVTAQSASNLAKNADQIQHIPAQTMADDQGAKTSALPMGSLFELSQMLVFELLVLRLRDIKGETAATMLARGTPIWSSAAPLLSVNPGGPKLIILG